VWPNLPVDWAGWNTNALANPNIGNFNKTEWKLWILFYTKYFNAFEAFLTQNCSLQLNASSNSGTSNNLSGTSNSAATTLSNTNGSCIGDVGDNVIISGNSNASLNFSAIWIPIYDLANITVDEILADLNSSSSIVAQTINFFGTFFGPNGFVPLNTTFSIENQAIGPIDRGLSEIALWLLQNVQEIIIELCPTCTFGLAPPNFLSSSSSSTNNSSNGSGGASNNGTSNSTNSTVPPVALWWPGNYSLPANCSYANSNNASVTCSQGVLRTVTYTFAEMNQFWQ
jgi:hypothetical protein